MVTSTVHLSTGHKYTVSMKKSKPNVFWRNFKICLQISIQFAT